LKKKRARSLASLNNAEKARAYAFLLLKFRLRSENELLVRLKQKGFSEELSQDTVNFLKDKEFVNDRVFARGWVASRLRRPLGLSKIRQELIQKGLDKEIIDSALSQVKEFYNESQIVSQLAQKRFSKIKGIEPVKAKARVYAYLIRRGFAVDIVGEVVKKL
jgi:regulatory protein